MMLRGRLASWEQAIFEVLICSEGEDRSKGFFPWSINPSAVVAAFNYVFGK